MGYSPFLDCYSLYSSPMALIHYLQTILPANCISYVFPLLIVVALWISCGDWFSAKYRTGAMVYVLSVFTDAIARTSLPLGHAAVVGGIVAPATYGLLFVGIRIIRILRTPYGSLRPQELNRPNGLKPWSKGLIGGCVGGIIGTAWGISLGYFLLSILPLLKPSYTYSFVLQASFEELDQFVILMFLLGSGTGFLMGLGSINPERSRQKALIYLSIYCLFFSNTLRKVLRPLRKSWKK